MQQTTFDEFLEELDSYMKENVVEDKFYKNWKKGKWKNKMIELQKWNTGQRRSEAEAGLLI